MLEFKQSEIHAERRRWLFKLTAAPVNNEVPSGLMNDSNKTFTLAATPLSGSLKLSWNGQLLVDGGVDYTLTGATIVMENAPSSGNTLLASYEVTSMTGQTGTGYITKNGAAGVATTASMVEVDATNMPGVYYIQLTEAELGTLGFLGLYAKTATSIAVSDTALVSYNDPYLSAGGFSSGTGASGLKLTKKQLELLAELVWKYKVTEENTAQEKLLQAAEHLVMDMTPVMDKIDAIEIPVTNITPVLERIDNIVIPQPKDYTVMLNSLSSALKNFEHTSSKDLQKTITAFTAKMSVATKDINGSLATVAEIKNGFTALQEATKQFTDKVSELSDVDRKFELMTSTMQKQQLTDMVQKMDGMMKKLLIAITDQKYQILKELTK